MGKRIALDSCNTPNKRKKINNHRYVQNKSEKSSEPCSDDDEPSNNISINQNSPKPEFQLSKELVNGTILTDLTEKQWLIGNPIGKGSFGEIFLASDNISSSITKDNAKYVVKIEPHSNGPLFVEIHCLLNTAKKTDDEPLPPGMPEYIASGSHYFRDIRYRFLVIPRFDRDLHSLIKNRRVDQKSVLILAVQILDILQHIHNKGYCHSDIKAENLMIGKCTYRKQPFQQQQQQKSATRKNGRSNKQEDDSDDADENEYNDDNDEEVEDDDDEEEEDDEEEDDVASEVTESDSESLYKTPVTNKKKTKTVQYSGSNPVRSCRTNKQTNSIYQEMINSHYLRPTKKINYSAFFHDENSKSSFNDDDSGTIDEYISNHRLSKTPRQLKQQNLSISKSTNDHYVTEDRIFLIDFGLASKFIDSNGVHRPFCMDQRRAHDGTLEFTSRDAHMGAHSRRSDLECLGYNLIFWSQGYLPWKEKAAQQQHEKVHWMKEYLMTDVRQMLKLIYGKQIPKYLGDFMYYVGKLSYDERPDYIKYRKRFERELSQLNIKPNKMQLNIDDLIENSIDINDEIENKNFSEMKNVKSIMKNLGCLMPFRENNSNRVSPKNLRSKSDKNSTKKKKKFSWAEILSQNPDQIARERAEKEYEREQTIETPIIRYQGKPTYAIIDIQNRIKFKDRLDLLAANNNEQDDNLDNNELNFKGYTKRMMDVIRKRQASLYAEYESRKKMNGGGHNITSTNQNQTIRNQRSSLTTQQKKNGGGKEITTTANNNNCTTTTTTAKRTRTKEGLRTIIRPTKRAIDYNQSIDNQKTRRQRQNIYNTKKSSIKSNSNSNLSNNDSSNDDDDDDHHNQLSEATDESSSCSSLVSVASSNDANSSGSRRSVSTSSKKSTVSSISNKRILRRYPETSNSSNSTSAGGGATSSSFPASLSDEDTRDVMVVFNPKQTRYSLKNSKINSNNNSNNTKIGHHVPSLSHQQQQQQQASSLRESVSRRKKSVPQKRNPKGELMRCV